MSKEKELQIDIRSEKSEDYPGVSQVLFAAFGQEKEVTLVNRLRENPSFMPGLSLVAVIYSNIVGYILLTPIAIVSEDEEFPSLALAPVAVLPEYQGKNIGARLVTAAMRRAAEMEQDSIVVLGQPEYYVRFGFEPAAKWGVRAPFDAPNEAFMAKELHEGGLQGVSGIVRYPEEFDDL